MATAVDNLQKAYAICMGTFLEVLGLVGFVSHPIANVIGVNYLLSFLHLVIGALGWLALKGFGRTYNAAMGALLLLLGVIGFLPGDALSGIFAVNVATSALHAAVGGVSLAMAFGVKE
jgi:uncharacterized protein DUF4383